MAAARIFAVVLAFFVAWSLAKPPMQAADEFSHTARVESIPDNLWFSRGERLSAPSYRINPYINSSRLRELPFHPERSLTNLEINALKLYDWGKGSSSVEVITNSHSYATGYFAPEYIGGRFLTWAFRLQPFESNWAYRLISCIMSAALFSYFILLLKDTFPQHWGPMSILVVVNPQIGFTLSAIHPDALFTPAAAITTLLAYRGCIGLGNYRYYKLILMALVAVFAKPLATPMSIALMVAAGIFAVFYKAHRKDSLRALIALGTAMLIAQLLYFMWVKLEIYGVPLSLNIWGYLSVLPEKPGIWFRQFFGVVGWLDTSINRPWHALMLLCLVTNLAFAAVHAARNKVFKPWLYLGMFSATFITGLLAGEFKYLEKAGFSIQGRYLFPILPFVALAMTHNAGLLKRLSVAFVLMYSAAYYNHTVQRYFYSGWNGWVHNLPFWRSNDISVISTVPTSGTSSGLHPSNLLIEGPMVTYDLANSTRPAITLSSTPPPYLTEMRKLPQPELWRVSILYRSQEEAVSALQSIRSE